MESLGELLKETRQNKNHTMAQIANETHIALKYLEALENEEFSVFPGEPYLKGFLRTYSTYLGLDPDEMIRLYEKIKMAETPTPIEQLIPKPRPNLRPFFVISLLVILFGGAVFGSVKLVGLFIKNKDKIFVKKEKPVKIKKEKDIDEEITVHQIADSSEERIFNLKKGDVVEFAIEEETFNINIKELSPTVVVNDSKGKELFLIKSYHHKIDVNEDQNYDIEMTLNFWDDKIANVTMNLYDQDMIRAESLLLKSMLGSNPETISVNDKINKIKFILDINKSTFLRYQIDDQNEVEGFFDENTSKIIEADRKVMLWTSNAGAVDLEFTDYNKTLSPGNMGKIMVNLIGWYKLSDEKYELKMSSLN